jgi:hypothetical protein
LELRERIVRSVLLMVLHGLNNLEIEQVHTRAYISRVTTCTSRMNGHGEEGIASQSQRVEGAVEAEDGNKRNQARRN